MAAIQAGATPYTGDVVMQATDLTVEVSTEHGWVTIVDGVNLAVRRNEVVGLVGESGSGKTTLGRALLGLTHATAGSIMWKGQDLAGLGERKFRPLRRHLSMVFQDPNASLNPATSSSLRSKARRMMWTQSCVAGQM